MKLIFSLWIVSVSAHSSLIQLTFPLSQERNAHVIKEIFTSRYSIPQNLIKLNRGGECRYNSESQNFHLCLDSKSDLSLIGNKRDELIKKSILSFSEKKGGNSVVTY